jgi:hypothetical protein
VYSRCARPEGAYNPDAGPLAGCDLYATTLGQSGERRLRVSRSHVSEFAPAIWRGSLAFGRVRPGQRRADIVLKRRGRPLRRLGAGSLPSCIGTPCRDDPSMGWPTEMDLGPRAVAYDWRLFGGDTFLDAGSELRIARLDGSRARIADAGWSDGECGGTQTRSPNVSGTSVRYGYTLGGCGGGHMLRRFALPGLRRYAAAPAPTEVMQQSLAWDGVVLYWIRRTGWAGACTMVEAVCDLVRTTDPKLRPISRGEARSPIEVCKGCKVVDVR